MATGDPSSFWNLPGPPGFDQVNADYQTYLGRPLTQDEYQQYWANKTNYTSNDVAGTPEAVAYNAQKGNPGPIPTNPDTGAQIGAGLPWANGAPVGTVPGYHWDARLAMWQPGDPPSTTPPADPNTGTGGSSGGGSSGGSGGSSGGAPPGTGWQAPAGPPASGFGSEVATYTPPVYASNPNAPQFTPLPAYVAPTWTGGDFVNPTMEEVQASPGYQSRLDQLMKTRERQSAAQGTILSGGTLKALDRAGQDYATGEYQTYRTNALENYKQRYGQFTDAAGMDYNARTLNANENNQTFQNQTNTYNTGNARTLSDYITNVSGQRTAVQDAATAKRNAETDYWSRLQDLNSTGSQLASSSYRV
jgi:hypothetical protein